MIYPDTTKPEFQPIGTFTDMSLETHSQPGPPIYNPVVTPTFQGKRNWWKILVAVLDGNFGSALDQIINGNKVAIPAGVSNEQATTIRLWLQDTFLPFLSTVTKNADTIISQNSLSAANLATLNETLNKLCIIRAYFALNDNTTFLSDIALDYRYDLIVESLDAVEKITKDKITSLLNVVEKTTSVKSSNYNFSPLITQPMLPNYVCANYFINTGVQTVVTPKPNTPAVATDVVAPKKDNDHTMLYVGIGLVVLAFAWPSSKSSINN